MLSILTETELMCTLLALASLLGFAYIIGTFFEKIMAPRVVGEIIGGMLLGGTGLYALYPDIISFIFNGYIEEGKVLNIFYQLGLIFLMFLSGYNTKLNVDKNSIRSISCLFFGATILPMLLAIPFIKLFRTEFIGIEANDISFNLVFVIGIAITSIPVISKIFFEMGIMNTRFSDMVLTVATFQDLCLWILLNTATRIAAVGRVEIGELLVVVITTLGLFIFVEIISNHARNSKKTIRAINFYSISFVFLLGTCAVLAALGINIMYAAFLAGYIVRTFSGNEIKAKERMDALGDFAFSFFIPIYFALVGIQLDLLHEFSIIRFLLFFTVAFGLEFFGTYVMLLFTKLNLKAKVNLSVTMNARGGPGIVLATVAYSYRIISLEFFTVLILTTMLSSMIAGYWLRRQQKKDESIFMKLEKEN